ncbi:MAG: hypothetical protein JWO67_2366 [Streptosporangiaceae bacterium]|jgi:hypothetical protein|nr:hypothetical protein [Streptosporangiaceae bacterium]
MMDVAFALVNELHEHPTTHYRISMHSQLRRF